MENIRTIKLPEQLCQAVEQKFSRHFGSLEEFVTAALREFLRDDDLKMDEHEHQVIEERLKALGYI
jgi:Arc/MetJ-type ribon-helix-helix transcriptional regulator